jgi:sulfur carrier protein
MGRFQVKLGRQIKILVNGVSRDVPGGQSVSELLQWLEIRSDRVAVELDKTIVRKRDWASTPVSDGAEMEVVEFVGGG